MNIQSCLKDFIKRKNPSHLPEGSEGDWSNYYDLKVDIPGNSLTGRLEKINGNHVTISFPNALFERKEQVYDLKDLKPEYFSGLFFYKKKVLKFDGLGDITPTKRLIFKAKSSYLNIVESVQKRRFAAQEHRVEEQIDFLEAVRELHMRPDIKWVSKRDLLNFIHGKFWMSHPNRDAIEKDIDLYIEAFISTGDLKKIDNSDTAFLPTGKMILTIQKYSVEQMRYKESKKMQSKMFWTAVFSFIAAAVSAYAAVFKQS